MVGLKLPAVMGSVVPLLGLGLGLAVAVLFVLVLSLRARLNRLRAEHARVLSDANISHEILATAPDGLFLWVVGNNSEACSRRLAVLLGLRDGVRSTFRAVMDRFSGEDAKHLTGYAHKLRSTGAPFECIVTTKDGQRRLLVVGVRAGTGTQRDESHDEEALADVLWMRDVSNLAPPLEGASISAHDIIKALPLPAWLRGGRLGVQTANAAACALGAPEAAQALAQHVHDQGERLSERHLLNTTDGAPRLLDITEAPLPGGGGIGIAQDLTRGEEMESAFARHIQAQNQVMETLATAIAIFDKAQKLTFANRAYARLWDMNPDWLADSPTYGDILDRCRERRRLPEVADFKAFKTEQTAQFGALDAPEETLMHLPDGTALRAVTSPHPLGGLVFAYEDVTGHLDLQRNYKTLSAVQRETLDNLYEGVAVFGADGRLKLHNPAFARIWKLPDNDETNALHMQGFTTHIQPLIRRDEGTKPLDKASLADKLMRRESRRGHLELSDGKVLDYAQVPLPDGAVMLSYLDVSDSARVESALLERAHAMAEANVLKSEFMAGVSHEIRTPLNAIVGFAAILSNAYFGNLNTRQTEYCEGIQESAEELVGIIDNMLDLASVEAGLMTLELDTVDINQLLVTAMNLVRERARRKNVSITFDSPADIGWVVADEKRLKQVMFNLLSSAVAATPTDGTVLMTARRDGNEIVFSITDGGTGMKSDDVPPGLALISRFIELHNGRVEMTNRPGRGVSVTCYLPVETTLDTLREPDLFSGFTIT